MRLALNHDDTVLDWILKTHGDDHAKLPGRAMGVINAAGKLEGAFVVVPRSPHTAELSFYGKTSSGTWRAMFRMVFAAFSRLEMRVNTNNASIKRHAPKLGFKFQAVERDYFGPGQHGVAYWMTPERCRWLRELQDGVF